MMMSERKTVIVVGGPIRQKLDPVFDVVPSGNGQMAENIAKELEKSFSVQRIGSFPGGNNCYFHELQETLSNSLEADAIIFLANLPNVLFDYSEEKIRAQPGEAGQITFRGAEKLVGKIKQKHKRALLVPFKLANQNMTRIEIVKWMLNLHSNLAVYSRLGDPSRNYWIIDVFGNETQVTKDKLPSALSSQLAHYLKAVRRTSRYFGPEMFQLLPPNPSIPAFQRFAAEAIDAFSQLAEKNVKSGRWPGNFSSRIGAHHNTFIITKRDVDKNALEMKDFVMVDLFLDEYDQIRFWGEKGLKPSTDAPVHRIIYDKMPWVKHIVHGHLELKPGDFVHPESLTFWPCGSENEGYDIVAAAPRLIGPPLWAVNIQGHGFVALLGEQDPTPALQTLAAHLHS